MDTYLIVILLFERLLSIRRARYRDVSNALNTGIVVNSGWYEFILVWEQSKLETQPEQLMEIFLMTHRVM